MKRSSEMTYDESYLMSPRITAVNDLIGQQQRRGSSVVPSDIGIVRYTYDLLGRVTEKTIQATFEANSKLISISSSYLTGTAIKSDIAVSFPIGKQTGSRTFHYCFDERGRIKQETSSTGTIEFSYDVADRLTAETLPTGGSKQYTYHADGSIALESLAAGGTMEYTYDRGRLISRGSEAYSYDNLGNCVSFNGTPLAWHRGSLLKQYGSGATAATYRYDNQGVRFEKVWGGVTTRFFHDGAKIVDELRGNIRIRYLYDAEEIIGFFFAGNYYYFVKDALGNVRAILQAKKITPLDRNGQDSYEVSEVARYTYDAWGNCTATAIGDANIRGVSIADFNPIRWKSQYYDTESGFYYIGGRYYSPVTKQYLSAANVETVVANAAVIYGLNLYTLTIANPVNMTLGGYTIETNMPLAYDPPELNWWERFWQSSAGKIFAVALVAVALVMCIVFPHLGTLLSAAAGVVVSLLIGASIAGYQSYVSGKGFWRGFERYIDGNWAQSAAIAAITVIITVGVQAISAAVQNAGNKQALANSVTEQDGVLIQRASRGDFTDEAWSEIQSLKHNANGETISNAASGRKIHRGFMTDANGHTTGISIQGAGRSTGQYGFTDAFDEATNTIFELKPNNAHSIQLGIQQLQRYSAALGNGCRMVLVLY